MKQLLKVLFVVIYSSIFSLTILAAETDVFKHPLMAKDVKTVKEKIPQTPFIKANFLQTKKVQGLKKEFLSNGEMIFSIEKGLYWHIQKPFNDTFVFTQNGLLQVDVNGNKQPLPSSSHPFFKEFSGSFRAAFAGDHKELQKHFKVFYMPLNSNNKAWVLGLRPKTEIMSDFMSEMILVGDKYLQRVILQEKGGDSTKIEFSKIESNPQTLTKEEKNYFVF